MNSYDLMPVFDGYRFDEWKTAVYSGDEDQPDEITSGLDPDAYEPDELDDRDFEDVQDGD